MMKKIVLYGIVALGVSNLIGCSCDSDRQTTTTTSSYQSATVDTKDMHPAPNS